MARAFVHKYLLTLNSLLSCKYSFLVAPTNEKYCMRETVIRFLLVILFSAIVTRTFHDARCSHEVDIIVSKIKNLAIDIILRDRLTSCEFLFLQICRKRVFWHGIILNFDWIWSSKVQAQFSMTFLPKLVFKLRFHQNDHFTAYKQSFFPPNLQSPSLNANWGFQWFWTFSRKSTPSFPCFPSPSPFPYITKDFAFCILTSFNHLVVYAETWMLKKTDLYSLQELSNCHFFQKRSLLKFSKK